MPSITPQTVGVYFAAPIGDWSVSRAELPRQLLRNAVLLASISSSVGRFAAPPRAGTPLAPLGSMEKFICRARPITVSKGGTIRPLVVGAHDHCQASLKDYLFLVQLASMPIEPLHMYDYGGVSTESTNRVYGKANTRYRGVATASALLAAARQASSRADGLNRLGVNVTVLEQAPEIGGRLDDGRAFHDIPT